MVKSAVLFQDWPEMILLIMQVPIHNNASDIFNRSQQETAFATYYTSGEETDWIMKSGLYTPGIKIVLVD